MKIDHCSARGEASMQLKPVSEDSSNIVAIAGFVPDHGIAIGTCYRIYRNLMPSHSSNSYTPRLALVCLSLKSMLIVTTFGIH